MKRKFFAKTILIAFFAASTVFIAQAAGKDDITKVREATSQFQHTPAAQAAGYELIPGFDYCFQSYGVGGMGYHYINTNLLDTTVDLSRPEALIYAPDANGSIGLGAVEYMVPVDLWDVEHNERPQALGQHFRLNEKLAMYILQVWIWKKNPLGMFEEWNPDVSCPEPLPWPWHGPVRWR